eukprot:NODE_180_length_15790_cov_0.586706.p1 type:complete len:794 gc:universal NODE_180_length_15790_cov_0.586706:1353-3734(+)
MSFLSADKSKLKTTSKSNLDLKKKDEIISGSKEHLNVTNEVSTRRKSDFSINLLDSKQKDKNLSKSQNLLDTEKKNNLTTIKISDQEPNPTSLKNISDSKSDPAKSSAGKISDSASNSTRSSINSNNASRKKIAKPRSSKSGILIKDGSAIQTDFFVLTDDNSTEEHLSSKDIEYSNKPKLPFGVAAGTGIAMMLTKNNIQDDKRGDKSSNSSLERKTNSEVSNSSLEKAHTKDTQKTENASTPPNTTARPRRLSAVSNFPVQLEKSSEPEKLVATIENPEHSMCEVHKDDSEVPEEGFFKSLKRRLSRSGSINKDTDGKANPEAKKEELKKEEPPTGHLIGRIRAGSKDGHQILDKLRSRSSSAAKSETPSANELSIHEASREPRIYGPVPVIDNKPVLTYASLSTQDIPVATGTPVNGNLYGLKTSGPISSVSHQDLGKSYGMSSNSSKLAVPPSVNKASSQADLLKSSAGSNLNSALPAKSWTKPEMVKNENRKSWTPEDSKIETKSDFVKSEVNLSTSSSTSSQKSWNKPKQEIIVEAKTPVMPRYSNPNNNGNIVPDVKAGNMEIEKGRTAAPLNSNNAEKKDTSLPVQEVKKESVASKSWIKKDESVKAESKDISGAIKVNTPKPNEVKNEALKSDTKLVDIKKETEKIVVTPGKMTDDVKSSEVKKEIEKPMNLLSKVSGPLKTEFKKVTENPTVSNSAEVNKPILANNKMDPAKPSEIKKDSEKPISLQSKAPELNKQNESKKESGNSSIAPAKTGNAATPTVKEEPKLSGWQAELARRNAQNKS